MPDSIVVVNKGQVVNVVDKSAVVSVVAGGPRGASGTPGATGPRGPGILSNIIRITASTTAPVSPAVNDLWIDLS